MKNPRVLVVVPAFNEADSINVVITSLLQEPSIHSILVVDDGSTDLTPIIAKNAGAIVISHQSNLGVGAALHTGFKYAFENDFDFVLQFDADGQHRVEEIQVLIQNLKDNDILIGSRINSEGKFKATYDMSLPRILAIKFLSLLISKYTRTTISDATSGFRLNSRKTVRVFANSFPSNYLGDTVESLLIAHDYDLRIKQIITQMEPRLLGKPSHNFAASFFRYLHVLARILLFYCARTLRAPGKLIGK